MLGKHQVFDNLHVHVSSITMSAEETGDKVFIPRESGIFDPSPSPPFFLILEEELKELSLPYFCLFIFRN